MAELTIANERSAPVQPLFFGEPRALAFLAFTEAWERFSYYGMTSVLVLYMSQSLLLPAHAGAVLGLPGLKLVLETMFGPRSTLALASQIFGFYTGFVYFTPIVGGWIADRFLGRRRAVLSGIVLMCCGHLAMANEATFLIALVLLVVGCGLLKGNISAQVGALYSVEDEVGRSRGFLIFSTGINAGAICGPLLIGFLATRLGWHVGFGTSALMIAIGLVTYLAGYRLLDHNDRLVSIKRTKTVTYSKVERKKVSAIVGIMAITIFQSIAYYQNSNVGLIWIDQFTNLNVRGFNVPVAWFGAVDPAASLIFVPFVTIFIRRLNNKRHSIGELNLIGYGAWIAAAANLVLVAASLVGGHVSLLFPLAYDVLLGLAFLLYWPTLLSLVSRTAPPRLQATLMGTVFLTLFVANNLIGWVGVFYERLGPAPFWALNAAIAAIGGMLTLLLRSPLVRSLSYQDAPSRPDPVFAS